MIFNLYSWFEAITEFFVKRGIYVTNIQISAGTNTRTMHTLGQLKPKYCYSNNEINFDISLISDKPIAISDELIEQLRYNFEIAPTVFSINAGDHEATITFNQLVQQTVWEEL